MDYKAGICTFCGTGCGHLLKVNEGNVQGVFSSRSHPVSKGRLCVRGWNVHELLGTNERLLSPLVKKNGKLEKTSYDESISALVSSLKKYSPDEVAFLASPRSSNEENYLLMKLARSVFKTNNISVDSESGHRSSLNILNAGSGFAGMHGSLEDVKNAKFLLVVDIDITKQNPIIGSEIHVASRAGADLVVIDSISTQIAKLTKTFIQNKPGSSKLLVAAMAKALIDNNLVADSAKKSGGYDAFVKAVFSIKKEDVAAKSGIEYSVIEGLAKKLAAAETAMVFFPSGISGLDEDTISNIYNLFVLAGKTGKAGCGVNPIAGINNLQGSSDMGLAPDLLTGFQSVSDSNAVAQFKKAGGDVSGQNGKAVYDMLADKNSKLKALVVVDHDEGFVKYADEIAKLEFVAYIGTYDNAFKENAHVVLPVASYIETDGTFTSADRRVQLSKKKMEPKESVMPAWKLYATIASKASASWNYNSASDVMDEIAKVTPTYAGISYKKLEAANGIQWPCNDKNPNGTKCFAGNTSFVKVSGNYEAQTANDSYPLLLMVGKAQYFWHQNNIMKKTFIPKREYNTTLLLYPQGYVEMSRDDAKKLEVRDRWPVKIVSAAGEMKVNVKLSDDVKSGTAYVPYFIQDMIFKFLLQHKGAMAQGEDATIPVRIEKV